MYVHNEQFDSARTYLNALNKVGEEQIDFVYAQNVNLDRLTDRNYVLTPLDSTQLYANGKKAHPLNGYSRSLYYVLTGEKLILDPPEEGETLPLSTSIEQIAAPTFAAYPNPVDHTYVVEWSVPTTRDLVISVTDMGGRVVLHSAIKPGSSQCIIDMSRVVDGIYIASVFEKSTGETLFQSKIARQ